MIWLAVPGLRVLKAAERLEVKRAARLAVLGIGATTTLVVALAEQPYESVTIDRQVTA